MRDLQKRYFEQILSVCQGNKIELYVLMMPVRDNELKGYDDSYINYFNEYINLTLADYHFDGRYIDMHDLHEFKDYRKYLDITHLNSKSSDEFTKCFYKQLIDLDKNECVSGNPCEGR